MIRFGNRRVRAQRGRKETGSRGAALVLVLWVVLLLMVIASEFAFSMRVETDIAGTLKEESQSYYLAMAGVQQALLELSQEGDFQYVDAKGILRLAKRDTWLGGGTSGEAVTSEAIETEAVWDTSPIVQRENVPLGLGKYTYVIQDEDGKFNINLLRDETSRGVGFSAYTTLRNLLIASGVEDGVPVDTIMDSILDWRDPGDEHRLNGAESDWYEKNYEEQGFAEPYSCRNQAFATVEELLMVKGMTPEILYGTEWMRSRGQIGTTEEEEKQTYTGIYPYLTVYSTPHNINVNTAAPLLIRAAFPTQADQIIQTRQTQGIYGMGQRSDHFSIISTGYPSGGGVSHTIRAVVEARQQGKHSNIIFEYWNDDADVPAEAKYYYSLPDVDVVFEPYEPTGGAQNTARDVFDALFGH